MAEEQERYTDEHFYFDDTVFRRNKNHPLFNSADDQSIKGNRRIFSSIAKITFIMSFAILIFFCAMLFLCGLYGLSV